MTSRPWRGLFEAGDHWAIWRGAVGDSDPHRHLAAQAVIADAPISVLGSAGERWHGRCILIDPLVRHRLEPTRHAELIFLEASPGVVPDALSRRLAAAWAEEPPILLASQGAAGGFWAGHRSAGGEPQHAVPDRERLGAALRHIDRHLGGGAIRLADAAEPTGLSPERFRHVFSEVFGMSFRRYVLWRRIGRAVLALNGGAGATAAAHDAGFADGAHFSRTLKAMFGVSPRALQWDVASKAQQR
jgi:AraC-like DNA-binding protein